MKLPIGIQNFEELRRDNYVYVDKTKEIYELINAYKYAFLARPRRFGKSLLLDTMKCLFEG
ncbi:AAA family ATPase, partial [Caminibacter sp.]